MDIKARIDTFITDTGVVSVLEVDNEDQVRVVVENADYSNIIQIRGKLRGQSSSSLLKEIFGNGNEKINVSTYEQLVIECTALQPDMGVGSVRIIASSFNLASGSAISIDVPAGSDLTDIETLTFISGDNSISIEGSNSSKTIDLQVQNPLTFTPEDVANKSSNTSLGTSDILYPTQNAVKTYVDGIAVSGAPDADATTKGILKLTGDLGGTADSPTVPGLASKYDISNPAGYITLSEVPASAVTSVNTQTGAVVLAKSDIGLDQVDNTSDLNKPISDDTQDALDLKVDKAGDIMTGAISMQYNSQVTNISLYGVDTTGNLTLRSNDSFTTHSGDIVVETGDASGSDYAGSIYLTGGNNVDGNPANIQITAGQSSGVGANGSIILDSKSVVYLNQNASGAIDASSHIIQNVADPVSDQDAATRKWVDEMSAIDNVLFVSPNANLLIADGSLNRPYSTIAAALAVAVDNNVIALLPGTYGESTVVIPSTLSYVIIQGVASTSTVITNGISYSPGAASIDLLIQKVNVGTLTINASSALNGLITLKQSLVAYDRQDTNSNVFMITTESTCFGGTIAGGGNNFSECLMISILNVNSGLVIFENTKFVSRVEVYGTSTARFLDCELFGATEYANGNIVLGNTPSIQIDTSSDALGSLTGNFTKTLLANIPISNLTQSGAILGQVPTWNGSTWIPVTPSGSGGGVTDHTLLSNIGVKTHAEIDTHINTTSGNPHFVTKGEVGLGNVDDTSDLNKPISTATQSALNEKYDASNPDGYISLAEVPVTSVNTQTGAVVLDKSDIGLSNVDNTSDVDKPISSATQTALNDKYDASNPAGYITLAQVPADAVTSVNGLTGAVVIPTSSLIIQDEGTSVTSAAISMNFVGTAVTTSSDVSGNVTVSIAGAGDATTLIVEGYNQTGSAIPIMSVVYISGAHGNLPNLVLSQANTEATSSKTLGITRFAISNMSNGFVVATGRLEGLDTNIVGWNEGDSLWLSPSVAGGITNTKPSAPNHTVFLGTLIRKHPTQGVIEVKVQNGFELQELHNVSINGSLLDNQVLKYDAPNLLWKNETLIKDDVGLANVDNTSDVNKPISSATQTALNAKADSSHTHALTDLTQSSATNGQVPTWNGSNWVASTPASIITDHTALTNIGTYTHAQIDSHIPASSNVHGIGASSDVVGTATSQTLTNKTIDYNSNTILNLPSGGGASYSDVTIPALNIDWSAGTTFYKDISVSSTFTFSNIVAGKTITVVVYNSAAIAVSVTLPTVKKETGTFDTAIIASTANVYVFSSINGSVYASSITEVV